METKYLVRSQINPSLVLATSGDFLPEDLVGPGHHVGAKLYKTEAAAKRANPGRVVEPHDQTKL